MYIIWIWYRSNCSNMSWLPVNSGTPGGQNTRIQNCFYYSVKSHLLWWQPHRQLWAFFASSTILGLETNGPYRKHALQVLKERVLVLRLMCRIERGIHKMNQKKLPTILSHCASYCPHSYLLPRQPQIHSPPFSAWWSMWNENHTCPLAAR